MRQLFTFTNVPYRAVALGCLFAITAACSGSTAPKPDVTGTYVLSTIDGSPLPVTTALSGGLRYAAQSGNTILRSDGSFTKNHYTAVYNSANVLTQVVPSTTGTTT